MEMYCIHLGSNFFSEYFWGVVVFCVCVFLRVFYRFGEYFFSESQKQKIFFAKQFKLIQKKPKNITFPYLKWMNFDSIKSNQIY